MMKKRFCHPIVFQLLLLVFLFGPVWADSSAPGPLTADDVMQLRGCSGVAVSPNGQWIAYTVGKARDIKDEPGSAYSELYLMSTRTRVVKPFVTGKGRLGRISWSPDGTKLAFISSRKPVKGPQVWVMPIDGGEAAPVTECKSGISSYQWHPKENKIAFTATTPETEKEKKLKEKGFGFIFYEENLKHRNLFMLDLDKKELPFKERVTPLIKEKVVWSFRFSPDGKRIAAAISPKNLVDHNYMFRKIFLLDIASKKLKQLTDNPGKLGGYVFSPDSSKLAYARSFDRKDHAVSQAFVVDIEGGKEKNMTIPGFKGHVNGVYWKDSKTLWYRSDEGVWPTLSEVPAAGGERKIILHSKDTGIIFRGISFSKDRKLVAFSGSTPRVRGDLYCWKPGKKVKVERLTTLNPWLAQRKLGTHKVVRYNARDGQEIEGVLVLPVGYKKGQKYPLILDIHGGPEACRSNGWVTNYGSPAQVLAGMGCAVFFPNYGASTGYGLKFALRGYEDPAGKEFDDIADGIEYFIKEGIADRDRVGLGGGSYGGYAAAWFSSYYTKYVRAVVMFVGISNVISKRGTTDIPYEEMYVHSGKPLEEMWVENLKRSPVYWAHQSKTATLIVGGTADTRVDPGQSKEFHRRLKMNNHPAVRLVQYPGEGHGNRKQTGRLDLMLRTIKWYQWYVIDKKPFDGPMPPLDISDAYGIKL